MARRSSFGPIVLGGLATAALMTVAATQTWLRADPAGPGPFRSTDISGSDAAPAALALALVALAGWGVLLVARTRVRRLAAGIALLATLGVLGVLVALWPDAEEVAARVVVTFDSGSELEVSRTAWYWVTAVAAAAQVAVLLAALRAAPGWPTMSSRYDAPSAAAAPVAAEEGAELADLELWKALDEGHDPTAGENP